VLEQVLLILIGAVVSGVLGTAAWFWKRAAVRKDDRRDFLRSRMDQRDKGFERFLAACDAMQFIRADAYTASKTAAEPQDHTGLETQALVLWEDGIDLVRANVGDWQPFQDVLEYAGWVFLVDHPPFQSPGVKEFGRIRELVLRCKRVYQEQERVLLTDSFYELDGSNEYKEMLRLTKQSGSRLMQDKHGTFIATMSGDAMAEWLEGESERVRGWKVSRDTAWERMHRSGFFHDLPPRH